MFVMHISTMALPCLRGISNIQQDQYPTQSRQAGSPFMYWCTAYKLDLTVTENVEEDAQVTNSKYLTWYLAHYKNISFFTHFTFPNVFLYLKKRKHEILKQEEIMKKRKPGREGWRERGRRKGRGRENKRQKEVWQKGVDYLKEAFLQPMQSLRDAVQQSVRGKLLIRRDLPSFESLFLNSLSCQPIHLTSLCLRFPICEMEIIILSSYIVVRIKQGLM